MNTGSSTGDTGGVARRTSKGDSSSSSSSNDSEIAVLRRRDRNPNGKGWSKWKSILTRADEYYSFSFPDKQGELTIRTNFLNVETRKSIAEELMHQQHHMHLFRQYSIRSTPEPRVHFLLHSHATAHPQQQQQQQEECQLDDINNNKHPQPGYAYANIRMKAHALHCLPHVERLAQDLQIKYEATDTPPNHNNSNVKNRNDDANIRYFDVETIPIPTTGGATISSTATARVHDSDEVYMNNDVISNEDIAESVNQEDGSDKDDSDYKDSDDDALDSEKYVRNPKEFAHKQNCLGDFWTIGVDAILYRNGQDSMGFHADDDQGEQLIVTAIISSSSGEASRFIRFRRKRRGSKHYNAGKNLRSLDFELEMCLQAGDVYSMDGTFRCRVFVLFLFVSYLFFILPCFYCMSMS